MKRMALVLVLLMTVPSLVAGSPEDMASDSHTRAGGYSAPRANATDYSDVLLLINNQSAISMQVGNYFKLKRGIPDQNVCNISMPTTEEINQTQFGTIRSRVEAFIIASGLNGSLNYTVTTKGVPLKISNPSGFRPSFDDELSLILGPYAGAINVNGAITNPFYSSQVRFTRKAVGVFITTRLSGYNLTDCLALVDNSLNSTSGRGRFILDVQPNRDNDPGYKAGNDWMREANTTLVKRGYDVWLEQTTYYVQNQKNISGYCSWGSNDGNAPNNAKTNFTWVPGAIGTTYVSTSARSFNYPPSYGQSLIADNIREGITGIHGNVDEPYLTACARPHIFLDRYTRGWNLAESLSASMATASWQNCIIGDPKIEPYAVQPDPAVLPTDMGLLPSIIVEGMTVNITAVIRNMGGGPAQNTTVTFSDGDPAAGGRLIGANRTIPLLAAGGQQEFQATWSTTGLSGQHRIYATLTVSNVTQQLWEGNDQAYVTATVLQRPELVLPPERFTVSDRSPIEGATVLFDFNLQNTGGYPAPSTVELSIDGAPVQSKSINLQGGTEQNDRFSWNTAGHPGSHVVDIAASPVQYELNGSNNNLSAELFVRHYGLSMYADSQERSCLPGLATSFNITVESSSNYPENVNLSVSGPPQYWSASVEPAAAVILPNASSMHRLLVFSPVLASVSDRCSITVTCVGATSQITLQTVLNVTVVPVRRLELSCDPAEGTAIPGENATFKLDIHNLGNGPDTANISFEAPAGWNVELETDHLVVPYQGYASLVLKVSPSMSILAGKNGRVTVTATSADGKNYTATVDVEAEQYHGIAVFTSAEVITLRPGEESEFSLSICNIGNGADTYSLILPRTELGIDAPSLSFALEAFTVQNMTLTLSVPADYKQNRERLQFAVESPNAGGISFQLEVKVVRPDLSVSGGNIVLNPGAPVDGDTVNVTASIRNAGNAASGPVTVSLSEAGKVISTRMLDGLAPGENVTIVFGWNATAGSQKLAITAECGYPDPTPADASASVTVTVSPRPVHRPPSSYTTGPSAAMVAVAAAIILAAAAAIAVVILRRRKNAS
jgi:uncharacterized protein (TIGR03790 family)